MLWSDRRMKQRRGKNEQSGKVAKKNATGVVWAWLSRTNSCSVLGSTVSAAGGGVTGGVVGGGSVGVDPSPAASASGPSGSGVSFGGGSLAVAVTLNLWPHGGSDRGRGQYYQGGG